MCDKQGQIIHGHHVCVGVSVELVYFLGGNKKLGYKRTRRESNPREQKPTRYLGYFCALLCNDNSSLAPLTTWLRVLSNSDLKQGFQIHLIKILGF